MCSSRTISTRCLSLYGVRKYKVRATLRFLALFMPVGAILQAVMQHVCTQAGMIRQPRPPSSPAFFVQIVSQTETPTSLFGGYRSSKTADSAGKEAGNRDTQIQWQNLKEKRKKECHRQQIESMNWWTGSTSTATNTTTRMRPASRMRSMTAFTTSWNFGRRTPASS